MSISTLQNMFFAAKTATPGLEQFNNAGLRTNNNSGKSSDSEIEGIEQLTPDNNNVLVADESNLKGENFKDALTKILNSNNDEESGTLEQLFENGNIAADENFYGDITGSWKDQLLAHGIEIPDGPAQNAIARLTYLLENKPDSMPGNAAQAISAVIEKLQLKADAAVTGEIDLSQKDNAGLLNINDMPAKESKDGVFSIENNVLSMAGAVSISKASPDIQVESSGSGNQELVSKPIGEELLQKSEVLLKTEPQISQSLKESTEPEASADSDNNVMKAFQQLVSSGNNNAETEQIKDSDKSIDSIPKLFQQSNAAENSVSGAEEIKDNSQSNSSAVRPSMQSNSSDNIFINAESIKVTVEQNSDNAKSQTYNQEIISRNPVEQIISAEQSQNTPQDFKSEMVNAEPKDVIYLPDEVKEHLSEQIHTAVRTSTEQGRDEITVQLNPPELGRVFIKLQQQDGQVTGLLEFSRIQTRIEVEQLLPQVVKGLQDAGVAVRRLDVVQSQTDSSSFEQFKDHAAQDNSNQQQQYYDWGQSSTGGPNVYQWLNDQIDYKETNWSGQSAYSDRGVNVLV